MDFDFSHTWLDWDHDEGMWFATFFSKMYPHYQRYHKDKSAEECLVLYDKTISEIISIISKGLFARAHELRRSYYAYHLHKHPRTPEDNLEYFDQVNIKNFLSNLDSAIEIEFELQPRTIQSPLLNVNETFSTIMAVNIRWLDSSYKARRFDGKHNGGRVEAYMHFHKLFIELGWEDESKRKTHIYEDDENFQFYVDTLKAYFTKFITYNHYTKGKGLKQFAEDSHELASYLWDHIEELSSEDGTDKQKVAKYILDLFRIPNDLSDEYNMLEAKADVDVFARYLTIS